MDNRAEKVFFSCQNCNYVNAVGIKYLKQVKYLEEYFQLQDIKAERPLTRDEAHRCSDLKATLFNYRSNGEKSELGKLMEELNITQEELANHLNVSQPRVSLVVTSKRNIPQSWRPKLDRVVLQQIKRK